VVAAAAAAPAGPNVAGAAAGKVFAEVDAYARASGAAPETFAGLAGSGDLVATVVAAGSRNRRAGELLSRGVRGDDIAPVLGHAAEGVDAVPLLAGALRDAGVEAPTLDGLAALIEGRIEPESWARTVTAPGRPRPRSRAA
jgi:glycerol-3-phosphate dehydrogenase